MKQGKFLMKQSTPITVRQRMGRPRRNPETVRSKRVVTFVTKSELAKLECIAEQNGISLSASIHLSLTKFLNDAERCEQLSNVVE